MRSAMVDSSGSAAPPQSETTAASRKRKRLLPAYQALQSATVVTVVQEPDPINNAHARVVKYVRLLEHLRTAPWASGRFEANEDILLILSAGFMPLIAHEPKPSPDLYKLLGSKRTQLETTQNTIWVTNRQQGKTTLLGMVIAAMALSAAPCKTLACVYSTKQERAAELCRAAKDYLYWMRDGDGKHPYWNVHLDRDNERAFSIRRTPGEPASEILARPRNPDTCRGDNPRFGIFDEIAFTSPSFWYTFALPLLQVRSRRFVCCTTPPPRKSFFDEFSQNVKRANVDGDNFFTLINHSLACSECIANDVAADCCHRLGFVPPWKSVMAFNALGKLMPKHKAAEFAAEVFGVMEHRFSGFIDERLISAASARPLITEMPEGACRTIWVGVDPPAHSRSAMGLVAMVVGNSGQLVIIGIASVDASATEIGELQHIVGHWIQNVRQHPFCHNESPIVPIIECNNNEPLSLSLLRKIQEHPPVYMPFTKDRFYRGAVTVADGVGVWTTESSKLGSLHVAYQAFMEGRVAVASNVISTNRESIDRKSKPPVEGEMITLLFEQLGRFGYDKRGKVTGKLTEDDQDDIAMAFLICIYFRLSVLAADSSASD